MPRPSRIEQAHPTRESLQEALQTKTPAEIAREIGVPQSQLYHHCKKRGWALVSSTEYDVVELPEAA